MLSVSINGIIEKQREKIIRQKGKSLLTIPKDYTILDLETTGLDPNFDNIIEVSCIKYRNNEEIDKFTSLIQPPLQHDEYDKSFYIDDFITDLTGITNEMLSSAPKFNDISNVLWKFLNGELIVAHNANFDINFLYDNFKNVNNLLFNNNFVDTLRLSRWIVPDLKNYKLKTLAKYFNISEPSHRAESDCQTTYNILMNLSNIVQKNNIDLEQLQKLSGHDLDLRLINVTDNSKVNKDHIFYDRVCVFTGKLTHFTRKEAAQLVTNIGSHCENGVTKRTNFLIVGNFDYVNTVKNNKSSKIKKAEKLILEEQDLQIITEDIFCQLLADYMN